MIATQTQFPLRLRTADALARIRQFLREATFDDATLCRVLEMENMSDLGRVDWPKIEARQLPVALAWCLRVFARGQQTDGNTAREICGELALAALLDSGLLLPAVKTPGALVCPVWLYPLHEFVLASDRVDDPEGGTHVPPTDVVFPAIYAGTLRFLELLPDAAGGDALDLCGGSGIGAMILARTARRACTADLAERSARFAEFNARLNGLAVESLCGGLYAPVAGRQFDLITAHPPFVPATGPNMVYRDGGDSGEEVFRGVVEGLPAHLRVGGTCVILAVARDTEEGPVEERVRKWLGGPGDEFDVIFGQEKILSVQEVVASLNKRGGRPGEDGARQLYDRLQSLGTRQFVYGALYIRRHGGRFPLAPARLRITPRARAADFARQLRWRGHCAGPDFAGWLAGARPRLAAETGLTVRHVVRDGSLTPAEFTFEIDSGFQAALRLDGWVVPLVARLEGGATVAGVFAAAEAAGELPAGFKLEDFAGLVRRMIDRGFLEVDDPPEAR